MSLFGLFERRDNLNNPAVPLTSTALLDMLGGTRVDSGMHVSERSSLGMSAAYRCVSLISSVSAALPIKTYKAGTKDTAVSTLLANPHPDLTPYDLWKLSYCHRCLWGNSYQQKIRSSNGRIQSLWPITPDRVRVGRVRPSDLNQSGKIFEVTDDWGVRLPFTSREILHIPGLGYDGTCGVSPIRIAAQAIGLSLAAESYAARLFGSGNLLSGILQTEQRLKQEDADRLQARWRSMVGGLDRAHDVAVLDSGAKFQNMTMPSKDAEMLESRTFQVSELSRFFGVPPFLMMEQQKSTSWGCLPGDALVFTTLGPRAIEDVQPGDEVWSFTGDGMVPAKVTAWQHTGYKPLLTIKTTTRQLRVTSNHRVPIRRHFGKAEGRRKGQCGWETVEVGAGEIRPGDYLLIPHGLTGGRRMVAPNGRRLTVGAMELCGMFLGDGSTDGRRIELAHETDGLHMDHYRQVVRDEFGVEPYTDRGRATRTRFSSTEARALLDCGFVGVAHTKRVPGWVFRLDPELQLGLLRGYLDADGGIARGVISFASVNRLLLEDMRHLCIGLGIPVGRVHANRPGGTGVIRGKTFNSRTKYVLNLSSVPFNARIGSNHPAKAANLVTTPTTRRLRYDGGWEGGLGDTVRTKRAEATPGGTWGLQDVRLQRVVSIDEGDVAVPVYDITVADHSHFVADGVIVHNTGLEQQAIGWVKFDLHSQWLAPTEQRITKEITGNNIEAKYSIEGLLRGDSQARAEFYRVMREIGAYSADDIRDLEDLQPIPGGVGKIYLQPMNFVPLGTQPAEQPPLATDPGADDEQAPVPAKLGAPVTNGAGKH